MREPALHVLEILLLRSIRIVSEMLPVNLAAKATEILRLVRERVVISDFEPPIVDEVQFRRLTDFENRLRKIPTLHPHLRPNSLLGVLQDQVIAISHDEVHCQTPGTPQALAQSLMVFARKMRANARISITPPVSPSTGSMVDIADLV